MMEHFGTTLFDPRYLYTAHIVHYEMPHKDNGVHYVLYQFNSYKQSLKELLYSLTLHYGTECIDTGPVLRSALCFLGGGLGGTRRGGPDQNSKYSGREENQNRAR
jgi:hypothetical protein